MVEGRGAGDSSDLLNMHVYLATVPLEPICFIMLLNILQEALGFQFTLLLNKMQLVYINTNCNFCLTKWQGRVEMISG